MAGSGLIPIGDYAGKILHVSELKESKNLATPYHDVTCVITEDGDYKGRRIMWTGFLGDKSRQRTFQAFLGSGCTFPNDDLSNFEGAGTKEQILQIEHETYTPDPTDDEPEPKARTRARVAWINNGPLGLGGGKAVDEGKRRALQDQWKADLARARTGSKESGPDAQGNTTNAAGDLIDGKTGKKKF